MNMANAILVWRWQDAPEEYRNLSPHGGDEDWVAFVPYSIASSYIAWLEEGSSFGCCSVSEHGVPGGIIKIGAHA